MGAAANGRNKADIDSKDARLRSLPARSNFPERNAKNVLFIQERETAKSRGFFDKIKKPFSKVIGFVKKHGGHVVSYFKCQLGKKLKKNHWCPKKKKRKRRRNSRRGLLLNPGLSGQCLTKGALYVYMQWRK